MRSIHALNRYLPVLVTALLMSCSQSTPAEAPPTPEMPGHWTVTADESFAPSDIKPVAEQLGGDLNALRNTTYDVGGNRIKLNTIVAKSSGDADAIMTTLGKMKAEEWFLRRELIIYEFVGPNEAIPDMREARMLLAEL